MSEILYECLFCGAVSPKSKWEEIEGQFRCPICGHSKIARKIRPPIAKKYKAT